MVEEKVLLLTIKTVFDLLRLMLVLHVGVSAVFMCFTCGTIDFVYIFFSAVSESTPRMQHALNFHELKLKAHNLMGPWLNPWVCSTKMADMPVLRPTCGKQV